MPNSSSPIRCGMVGISYASSSAVVIAPSDMEIGLWLNVTICDSSRPMIIDPSRGSAPNSTIWPIWSGPTLRNRLVQRGPATIRRTISGMPTNSSARAEGKEVQRHQHQGGKFNRQRYHQDQPVPPTQTHRAIRIKGKIRPVRHAMPTYAAKRPGAPRRIPDRGSAIGEKLGHLVISVSAADGHVLTVMRHEHLDPRSVPQGCTGVRR